MSELIDNRKKRKEQLKALILRLHNGDDFETVKKEFEKHFNSVSAKEITEIEQALIAEGLDVEKIQKLCDVHAAVFKGSIEDIHNKKDERDIEGHPVHTFLKENAEIEKRLNKSKKLLEQEDYMELLTLLKDLQEIDKHYAKKENLIFPFLEKHEITGPPKVMWAIDDEVRSELKQCISLIEDSSDYSLIKQKTSDVLTKTSEMVFKENTILIPMILETFNMNEWIEIENSSDEIGYSFIDVSKKWKHEKSENEKDKVKENTINNLINLGAGSLSQEEITCILNTLPFDMTFVDREGKVKYFSEGKERIFPRTRTIIGREVRNCHPPASVHIVEKLVADLKLGRKEHEDFWIKMGEQFVYIRYFAVRNKEGKFLGTLEVTQNIKNIVELEGEKRLVTE